MRSKDPFANGREAMEAQTVFTRPETPAFSAHASIASRNGWWLSTAVIVPVVRVARSRVWVPLPHPISRTFASAGTGGRNDQNAFRVASEHPGPCLGE